MSVTEYEVGRQPGPPSRARVTVEPVTLRVLGGAFQAVAKEMAGVLFRMSYSSIIRESEDLGAGIFDAEGRELCESDTTPLHIGSLPWYVRGFLHRLAGEIEDGDVIVHNHPYLGASHTPDIALAVPIFWQGELIAFSAVTAHVLDVGGSFPGINADAFDVYAEAKLYNGLRWYRRGKLNEDLDRMLFDNTRTETMNRGDMGAMLAACQLRSAALPAAPRTLRGRNGDECRLRVDGLFGAYAARGDREDSGRHLRGTDRVAGRRRQNPGRTASRRNESDRRGRRGHDRPDRLECGGSDGLQRAV